MNEKTWICDRKISGLIISGTVMMAGEMIVALANTVIAGQLLGETALSAVNLVLPVYTLIGFLAVLVGIGSSVCFSQEMGKFNQKGARELFSQGVIMSVGLGIVAFLILFAVKNAFVNSVADTPELKRYVKEYYNVLILMALVYPVMKTLCFIIYSDGGEIYSTLAYIPLIAGSIIISVFAGKRIGIAGIALGTVVSQFMALLVLLSYFLSKKCTVRFSWYVNLKSFAKTLRYSVADAGSLLCIGILLVIINIFFVGRFGSEKLPVLSAVVSMMEITIIFDGIGVAIQPLIGTYRGENNMKAIRHLMGTSAKIAIAEGVIVSAVVLIFPGLFVRVLGITNPALIEETIYALRVYGATLTASSVMLLISSYHLFTDRLLLVILNIGLKDCLMLLISIILLGSLFGVRGVWWGFAAGNIAALVVLVILMLVIYGKKDCPLYLDNSRDEDQLLLNIRVGDKTISWASQSIISFAKEHGASGASANKAGVSVEEVLTLAGSANGSDIYAEILADATGDEISIIIRDTGEARMRDADDEEMPLNRQSNGLSAYVMQTVAMSAHRSIEMGSMGMNRINLVFRK